MAASSSSRDLEETPTWAVAVVCFVLVVVSISIEQIIHHIGQWLAKRHKRALYESLEKIKAELMLLGFISLLLTVGQEQIAKICIPVSVGDTWHPCKKADATTKTSKATEVASDGVEEYIGRKLLWGPLSSTDTASARRSLAGAYGDKCGKGKVPLVSTNGIHQLHIFIFVLAVFHVLYCITTLALGQLKMRKWKVWERETKTVEYQYSHDPERFRFARETSFGRRHLTLWSRSTVLLWIVCFFRQFVRSVTKVDYLTLRHGFIMAHLAPQSAIKFDFQKYIKRSLEEDFKVVVGISPLIWFFAVLFLMSNAHGAYSYLWLPFIPLIIILLVGTKLQVIITKMGLEILDRGDVVKGVPVVQPADNHFWFKRPRLLLFLIHFVLFQNAFQLAFFAWTWYEFGLRSCFHERLEDVIIRISMGILIQILCSYVTLPLYALVTQMGSNMKSTIFNDRVAAALKNWHHTARKHVKQNQHRSGTATPVSPSRTMTPSPGFSPVHLLRHYRGEVNSRYYHSDNEQSDAEGSQFPSPHKMEGLPHQQHGQWSNTEPEREMEEYPRTTDHHEIDMHSADFSFAK